MEEKRPFRRGDATVSLAGKDKGLPLAVVRVGQDGIYLAMAGTPPGTPQT